MSAVLEINWVKPPKEAGGLDHLGVQAPCIQVYGQLLPGITNVTDRARYYSFYPWLFSEFEKRGWRSQSEVIRNLRKAECLFTMIAIRHGQVKGGEPEHASAVVGSSTLSHAVTDLAGGKVASLSDYAHENEKDKTRYFKNRHGGLGQYYFGALEQLKIMAGSSVAHARLTKGAGVKIAKGMSQSVPGDLFFEVLEKDVLAVSDLDRLSGFCHCKLADSPNEADLLTALLKDGWAAICDGEMAPGAEDEIADNARAGSLGLLIDLADRCALASHKLNVTTFRGITYAGSDIGGELIDWRGGLRPIVEAWRVYQRNEILSVAMQGLFFALLKFAQDSDLPLGSISELSALFWGQGPGKAVLDQSMNDTLISYLESRYQSLAPFSAWQDDDHEIQLSEAIVDLTHSKDITGDLLTEITDLSLRTLSAICCRAENKAGYGDVRFRARYLDPYPVNLDSIASAINSSLAERPLKDALLRFTAKYCLESHLRVALRKLRQQGQNTCRFEVTDYGLVIKSVPPATHTSPRFNQSVRILQDLGLLRTDGELLRSTEKGEAFLADVS